MIHKAGILIVLLAHDGHWFGGSEQTVAFQPVLAGGLPPLRVDWRLDAGRLTVVEGSVDVPDAGKPDPSDRRLGLGESKRVLISLHEMEDISRSEMSTLCRNPGPGDSPPLGGPRSATAVFRVPDVRVASEMTFRYQATDKRSAKAVDDGTVSAHVYPRGLADSAAGRLRGREVVAWDAPDGLSPVLRAANIHHAAVDDPQKLQFSRPDILLVGGGQLLRHPAGAARLLNLAAAGTNVLLLRQEGLPVLLGYPLVPRRPAPLAVLSDHPLMRHLRQWRMSGDDPWWTMELPAAEPIVPVAWWPPEHAAEQPSAVDAVLAVKTIGQGRVVYCQYPLGPWDSDPRALLFLDDALDYLMSPVVPAPRLGSRVIVDRGLHPVRAACGSN